MNDDQARRARARRIQLAMVAGAALIVGGTWATVGLIEHSFVWGFIAAITVDVVLALKTFVNLVDGFGHSASPV